MAWLTDAPPGAKLAPVVYLTLQEEAVDWSAKKGWKLLPLQTIGDWINAALNQRLNTMDDKMRMILGDLIIWCHRAVKPATATSSDNSTLMTLTSQKH